MPTSIKQNDSITEEEYLKAELSSQEKHEYVNGKAIAMAGANSNHGRLSANISRKFGNHLVDSPCEPYISDMKVKTSTGNYRYPDVLVVCDNAFIENGFVTQTPIIIVEVLSRTTRKTDEQDKLMEYINIPSLQEYVIIEQHCVDITVYRKNDDWHSKHYFLDQEIYFESIDLTLPVEEVYHRVENEDMIEFLENKEVK